MYAVLARYYDALHRELTDDVPLVLALATQAEGDILELGCGTGRLMQPLLSAGFAVTGVDNSAEMLAIARSNANNRLATLIQANMTSFEVSNTFSLIIISYNTLMHLNQTQVAATFKQVKQHLAPNGRLFIDVENPFAVASIVDQMAFEAEASFDDPQSGLLVTPYACWTLDGRRQIATVNWRYVRADGVVDSAEIAYHYIFPHRLQQLLSNSGLRWQTAYGDYDQSAYDEYSPRLILIAQ